jgi:hypothetical protein
MKCAICNGPYEKLGEATTIHKYVADYRRCSACGFVQVVNPHWLREAYETAMTCTDIGHVWRADYFSKVAKIVIHAFNDPKGTFLDYAAGYGISVRKMRDLGYDFRWYDKYSENLFARGFEANTSSNVKYDLVTAVEVFEHLNDPLQQISDIFKYSTEVLFTTELISMQPPPLDEWWYYAPEHGQHLAFYTDTALRHVARRFGVNFVSDGINHHLFTRKKISERLFKFVVHPRTREYFDFFVQRSTLLFDDFQDGRKKALASKGAVESSQGPRQRA